MREARLGTGNAPDDGRRHRHDEHRRHEPRGDPIRELLDRCAAALRLGDHRDDLCEQRVAADPARLEDEPTGRVQRAAGDGRADRLLDRHRLAGDHRFVDAAAALDDDAVDRHALARSHAQSIADVDQLERDVFFTRARDPARGLRCEAEQCADRAGRRVART